MYWWVRYKDSSKQSFKSSTRLECMMQDYPKSLPSASPVGFTVCDVWLGYSPVKNNHADAAAKVNSPLSPPLSLSFSFSAFFPIISLFSASSVNCSLHSFSRCSSAGLSVSPFSYSSPFLWGYQLFLPLELPFIVLLVLGNIRFFMYTSQQHFSDNK